MGSDGRNRKQVVQRSHLKTCRKLFFVNIIELKEKAVRSAVINVFTNNIRFVLQTAGVIVLARLLTPSDFGKVAMVTVFSMWLMNFGFNGFVEYILQKKTIAKEEINSIFWLHIFISLILVIIFAGCGRYLSNFYSEPEVGNIALVMSASFILYALYTCHTAVLQHEMKFGYLAATGLAATIISFLLAICAALNGLGYWAVVIRQLSEILVDVILVWLARPWKPEGPKEIAKALPALNYAIKVYLNFSLNHFSKTIDKILLGKIHGSTMLGNYDRACHFSQVPTIQLLSPLSGVALATMSKLKHDGKQLENYYIKSVSIMSFIGTVVSVVLMLTASDVVLLILGPEWFATGRILMALSPAVAATLVSRTAGWLHLSLGKPERWLRWNIVSLGATVSVYIMAVAYGAVAMGIGYSAAAIVLLYPCLWFAGRPIQLSVKRVFLSTWAHFLSGSIIICSWFLLSTNWEQLNHSLWQLNIILRILCTGFVGLISYGLLVLLLERSVKSFSALISLWKLFLGQKGRP
jgi:polysaccharide transporter, PST family